MKLNLGCGKNIKEGYINIDKVKEGADIIHDLEVYPYPFEDNKFDQISSNWRILEACFDVKDRFKRSFKSKKVLREIDKNLKSIFWIKN